MLLNWLFTNPNPNPNTVNAITTTTIASIDKLSDAFFENRQRNIMTPLLIDIFQAIFLPIKSFRMLLPKQDQ